MKLYEISKTEIKTCGGIVPAVDAGCYIVRDDGFIKRAFNYGNGTKKDMNRYMKDNACFCVWVDAETLNIIKGV